MNIRYKKVDPEDEVSEQLETLNNNLNFVADRINEIYMIEKHKESLREIKRSKSALAASFLLAVSLVGILFLIIAGIASL